MKDEFPEMPSLLCKRCGQTKKLMFFNRSTLARGGKSGTCRMCWSEMNREGRVGNPVPAATLTDWADRMEQRTKQGDAK